MNTYVAIRGGSGWRQLAVLLIDGVRLAKDRVRMYRERSEQRRQLRELDDRLLDDIGVTRAQAMQEADKPFWR